MENENLINEEFETEQETEQDITVEYQGVDYSEQFQTLIELQTQNNKLVAQNNVNQLFCIGTLSALLVILIMYNFLKKFM